MAQTRSDFTILDTVDGYLGREMPIDIIEFVTSPHWLDRPNLYPRQATLLKLIFLQEETFTQYDYDVIGEWSEGFSLTDRPKDETVWRFSGDWGIQPDVLDRMRYLRDVEGRKWFRTILNASGRRSGKGHLGALCGAYVLWNYISKGDPRREFGIDPDKRLSCQVFAGKKDQAKANQWRDLVNVIMGAPCFAPYIGTPLTESLTVMAPIDKMRIHQAIKSEMDRSSFEIVPKEATTMAARGPASFCLDPATPILTADLRWVPIGELTAGDSVIGVDEMPQKGQQRKIRTTQIVAVRRTKKPALKITLDDGRSLVCSPDHRWMMRLDSGGGNNFWREAKDLQVGNRLRHVVSPWEYDESREAGYLAGFFDGEGCIVTSGKNRSQVMFSQNPGDVLEGVMSMLRKRGFTPVPSNHSSKTHDGKCEQWAITGIADCLRFLGQVRPTRLMNKASFVWEGITLRGGLSPIQRDGEPMYATIVSIEELLEQELVDIETGSHTFIANGIVSHNCQFYDEMAHMVATTGGSRSAAEVWEAATPALDQFKKDSFIYVGSSPWEMSGKFYELCQQAVSVEADNLKPVYPESLLIQLASWDIYVDWERTKFAFPMRPNYTKIVGSTPIEVAEKPFNVLRGAIQEYDSSMQRLERANPDTFRVERRAKWATSLDAYFPSEHVRRMFSPWQGKTLVMEERGNPTIDYVAHGDPGKTGSNFGFAIAHKEMVEDSEFPHVVFDWVHGWSPGEFPSMEMDYTIIEDEIKGILDRFLPIDLSFDQWNSIGLIQRLQQHSRRNYKVCSIYERTATANVNWRTAETMKAALSLGLIHCPYYELAELEMMFLKKMPGDKVDHPMTGPCTTKDVYDAMSIVVYKLIGNEIAGFFAQDFGSLPVVGNMVGPHGDQQAQDIANQFSQFGRGRGTTAAPRGFSPDRVKTRDSGRPF